MNLPKHSARAWHGHGETGASLVSAMIVVAIIGILVVVMMRSQTNVSTARELVRGNGAYRDMDRAFEQIILRNIRAYLNDNTASACSNPNSFMPATLAMGSWGAMRRTPFVSMAAIPPLFPPAAQILPGTGTGSDYQQQLDAIDRCSNGAVVPTGNSADARFYFCMRFAPTPGAAPQGTFMNSATAFAEVSFVLQNFQDPASPGLSCLAYNQIARGQLGAFREGGIGGVLYYSLYWSFRTSSGTVLRRKNHVAYVPSN